MSKNIRVNMEDQETVTIPKEEYERLKISERKIKIIDETIHSDVSTKIFMKAAEKSKSFAFLDDKEEDIYTREDILTK